MARWSFAITAVMLAPLAFPTTAFGPGAGFAIAILAAVVAVSLAAATSTTRASIACGSAAPTGRAREDRHRSGAFQRQQAPDTPGRPRQPRAPSRPRAGWAAL